MDQGEPKNSALPKMKLFVTIAYGLHLSHVAAKNSILDMLGFVDPAVGDMLLVDCTFVWIMASQFYEQ